MVSAGCVLLCGVLVYCAAVMVAANNRVIRSGFMMISGGTGIFFVLSRERALRGVLRECFVSKGWSLARK